MTSDSSLYGQSLYDLAVAEKVTCEILQEMESVQQVFAENPDYITLLSEPSIPKKERLSLVKQALEGQIHPYLMNFICILIEHGQIRGFSGCTKKFRSCYNTDNGIAEAKVTSAVALTDGQAQSLKARLEKLSGKTVLLHKTVDPDVLGGLRVEMEGMLYDGTVSGRLQDLGRKVNEIVV